ITVTAPKSVKINRVRLRDNVSKEKVIERMQNQLDDQYKMERSKYVINNLDLSKSEKEVLLIHQDLLK
ncbi:MAG: dephospho-CoA kinase, partial [Flavobacteriaceae bacterium]|nr:dephospho-CoA kinase [Flavobacteriaceae bacterium]